MNTDSKDIARLKARIENLEEVCAEAHQFAGTMGAPERLLDLFHDATQGKTVSLDRFTPVTADESDEVIRLPARHRCVERRP